LSSDPSNPNPTPTPTPPAQNPLEIVPEKYRRGTLEESVAELAKGYKALETKIGQPPAPLPPPPQPTYIPMAEAVSSIGKDTLAKGYAAFKAGQPIPEDVAKAIHSTASKTNPAEYAQRFLQALDSEHSANVAKLQSEFKTADAAMADSVMEMGKNIDGWEQKFNSGDPTQMKMAWLEAKSAELSRRAGIPVSVQSGKSETANAVTGFTSVGELRKAKMEARSGGKDYTQNPVFMARFAATDPAIRTSPEAKI